MIRASQLGALSDALASVLPLAEPADATLRNFFRRHPGLGQRDRAFVAEGTFATLRRLRSLTAQAKSSMPRSLAIAVTLRELGISLRDLEPVLTSDDSKSCGITTTSVTSPDRSASFARSSEGAVPATRK